MKSDVWDSVIITIMILAAFFVTYHVGYEMSERKNCIANKGHYSWDYSECIKGDLNERNR